MLLKVTDITDHQDLPAGDFSSWLRSTEDGLDKRHNAAVPCGECNSCCQSAYFIHVSADETDTLAHITKELLFPAPGQPSGTVLMGFDENGRCPMLVDGKCSIYEHRPQTCRNYDCRIFPAAGIAAGEQEEAKVTRHAARWRFSYSSERHRIEHAAVQAAAAFLHKHAANFARGLPSNPTRLALLAIKIHGVFLDVHDRYVATGRAPTNAKIIEAINRIM